MCRPGSVSAPVELAVVVAVSGVVAPLWSSLQRHVIGPVRLDEGVMTGLQVQWSGIGDEGYARLYWEHDRGLARTLVPPEAFYHSKDQGAPDGCFVDAGRILAD